MKWREIYEYLQHHPECLDQEAEVRRNNPDGDAPVRLEGTVTIGAIGDLEDPEQAVHSDHDWARHDEQVVLYTDWHSFGDNGEAAYDGFGDDAKVIAWAPGAGPK